MRFKIKNIRDSLTGITRKIGYRYLRQDQKTKEHVLVRPLDIGGYPRFHLFLKIDPQKNEYVFSLHLDQRRTVYEGAPAHSADYEGKALEAEAERIKQKLK